MAELTCPNLDCRLAETGKCVEGFEISECPHQQESAAKATTPIPKAMETTEAASVTDLDRNEVAIASGRILTIDEATDVLCAGPTRIVTVVGPLDSGKTTFGLSLYEAFLNGSFDRWSFAGSLTLPAFEQRCHQSRAESGRTSPDTIRTSISDGLGFLHLAVYSEETGRVDLLISDRAGEYYTAVANSEEECEGLHEIYRADYVLFLLDGKKLASDERHGTKHELSMMITALIDGGVLGTSHQVGIVLTKYDHMVSLGVTGSEDQEFNRFIVNIQSRFGSMLGGVNAFKIAARSENDAVENRFGILNVLEECLRPHRQHDHLSQSEQPLDRSFHRLPVVNGRGK